MFKIINKGFLITQLPSFNKRICTASESIHDGDTMYTASEGILPIRFSGIDTPETNYNLPIIKKPNDIQERNGNPFIPPSPIEDFKEYLSNPFDERYYDSKDFRNALGEDLVENHLKSKLNDKTAINHKRHAINARNALIQLIEEDIGISLTSTDVFKFYIAFSFETTDRFGRILGWVNKYNSDNDRKDLSYNEKMLKLGMAIPYFIWPNISPFRRSLSITQALPNKEDFFNCIEEDNKLSNARKFVKNAREQKLGIFEEQEGLMLMPFELRYLADRFTGLMNNPVPCKQSQNIIDRSNQKPVHRYVIDLSYNQEPIIVKPEEYYKIKVEDRLFIDEHFVPLFQKHGYQVKE